VVQVPAPTLALPICEGRPYDAIKEVAELKAALLLSDTARAQSEARAVEAEARVAAARAEAANSKTEAANLKAALVIAEAKAASYEDAKARAEAKAAAADSARVQMEATVAEIATLKKEKEALDRELELLKEAKLKAESNIASLQKEVSNGKQITGSCACLSLATSSLVRSLSSAQPQSPASAVLAAAADTKSLPDTGALEKAYLSASKANKVLMQSTHVKEGQPPPTQLSWRMPLPRATNASPSLWGKPRPGSRCVPRRPH